MLKAVHDLTKQCIQPFECFLWYRRHDRNTASKRACVRNKYVCMGVVRLAILGNQLLSLTAYAKVSPVIFESLFFPRELGESYHGLHLCPHMEIAAPHQFLAGE